MATALNPRDQHRVNELELLAHCRLHLIDDLNAELGEILHGDDTLRQMADTTARLHAEFRGPP
jgi:hypothetical protein